MSEIGDSSAYGRSLVAEHLRRLPLFEHFAQPQLDELAGVAVGTALHPGQILFDHGEHGDDFLLLVSGTLDVARETPAGEQIVAHLQEGELVGELSFLDGHPRVGTVVAWFASRLLRFPADAVRSLMEADDALAIALFKAFWKSLGARLRDADAVMDELIAGRGPRIEAAPSRGERIALDTAAKVEVFCEHGLDPRHVEALAATLRTERFAPQAFIFTEGEPGLALYIIAEGQVRISRRIPGHGEEALAILGRGEVFGELSLGDAKPRSADARAHTNGCTVLSVNRARLDHIIASDPTAGREFLALLCRLLCRRLRAMGDLLVAWRVMAGFG